MSEMEGKRAALQAEVAQIEDLLKSITERLDEAKIMLAEARAGKGSVAVRSLVEYESDQVKESIETRIALRKAKEELDRFILETSPNDSSSLPVVSPPLLMEKNRAPPIKKLQMTMNTFLLVISADGKLQPLGGPKVIADSANLTCQPCSKTFKSIEGLREHQRHCSQFRRISQGLSRDGRRSKKELKE